MRPPSSPLPLSFSHSLLFLIVCFLLLCVLKTCDRYRRDEADQSTASDEIITGISNTQRTHNKLAGQVEVDTVSDTGLHRKYFENAKRI